MGYDRKYGKVTTEFGDIPDHEPVVIFRSQDKLIIDVLAYYVLKCVKAGSPMRHVRIVLNTIGFIREWQSIHGSRIPNSDSSASRLVE